MALVRACAAALFLASLVVAGPAAAASHVETRDRWGPLSEPFDPLVGPAGGVEAILAGRPGAMTTGKAATRPVWISVDPDVPASRQDREHSIVPLPTGLSLFGAGILTLGLIGLFSGTSRRMALKTGCLADLGQAAAEAAPSIRFRIEIRSEHDYQMRHTASARGTIDLIADLLNDGWNLVCIRDRNGLTVDYDDVIAAWNNERRVDP